MPSEFIDFAGNRVWYNGRTYGTIQNNLTEIGGVFSRGTDATYFDDEYAAKVGWGHSPVSEVIDLAHGAEVKDLYLFHHDPDQDDRALERKLAFCRERLNSLDSKTVPKLAEAEEELVLQG